MTSCDTNILFHACRPDDRHHKRAARFLEDRLDDQAFVICELALVELYTLLRNPAMTTHPLTAAEAVATVEQFRQHPVWRIVDYPGGLMAGVWNLAAQPAFARRKIYDVRFALTLRHHGVTEFATRNLSDFRDFGFKRVWDPCA